MFNTLLQKLGVKNQDESKFTNIPYDGPFGKLLSSLGVYKESTYHTSPKATPQPVSDIKSGIEGSPENLALLDSLSNISSNEPYKMVLDYSPYIVDQNKVDAKFPNGLPQPSGEQLNRILSVSPNDATRSAILKITETGGFNDYPSDYTGNSNGTIDRGANMINSGTFQDMWNKQGIKPGTYPHRERMQNRGISSYEDMKNPLLNELMMDLIRKSQGYGAWYGPSNFGFDLNR